MGFLKLFGKAKAQGVIHMNHVRPDDDSTISAFHDYFSIGLITNGVYVRELAVLKVSDHKVIETYTATVPNLSGDDVVRMLGNQGSIIGYDFRANIPVFATVLGDVEANADWDYIDLKELAEYKKKVYTPKPSAEDEARAAIDLFEDLRRKVDIIIPKKIDDAPIAYTYSVNVEATNISAVLSAAESRDWMLRAQIVGDEVHIFSGETDVGVLHERAKMLSDWLRRDDPYMMCMERVNDDTLVAKLVFYKDRRKGQDSREQTVVALTGWNCEDAQNALIGIEVGDALDIEENFLDDEKVAVTYDYEEIGRLPSKIVKRLQEESIYGIWLEELEETDDGKMKPIVRIYW